MSSTTPDVALESDDLTAEQSLAWGDAAFVNEQYEEALTNYTAALAVVAEKDVLTRFRVHSHRTAVLYKLARYVEAYQDAVSANGLLQEKAVSGLRPGETEMCLRREGLAAFQLSKFAEALTAFQKAAQLASLNKRSSDYSYSDWTERCEKRLKPSPPPAPAAATKPAPQQPVVPSAPQPVRLPSSKAPGGAALPKRIEKPKYQYYQSDKVMTISILEPNVKEEDLQVVFKDDSVTVRMVKQGQEFAIIGGQLNDSIIPGECRVNIRDEKVLIKLKKAKQGEWYELMASNNKKKDKDKPATVTAAAKDPEETVPTVDSSMTRPYASKRDWSSIERQLAEEEENETPEGDEAMNKLFSQLYANADEDTRRAMIKSYQTSGGTVLSTNWDEVKKKDYEKERTAPDGVEWKTWEGKKLPVKDDED